jgi:hypothetical protein
MKVASEILIESYSRLNNVWLVGDEVGLCGQSVHERLVKLKAIVPMNYFTDKDKERLRNDYSKYLLEGNLELLATEMNRTKAFICRKAKQLGLTDIARKKKDLKNFVPVIKPGHWETHEHPRGMKGLKHSDTTKEIISQKSIITNKNVNDTGRRPGMVKKMLQSRFDNGNYHAERIKTTWKSGWREIGGKNKYFRSRWEANYARYLQFLKEQQQIIDWEHEPEMFWFTINSKEVSYLPDFRVTMNDNSIEYHEVKGWMDERSKLKIEGMKTSNPDKKLLVIQGDWFGKNNKIFADKIKDWE